jgi:hypothetical protein
MAIHRNFLSSAKDALAAIELMETWTIPATVSCSACGVDR